jgi:hypothetical protein
LKRKYILSALYPIISVEKIVKMVFFVL